jgi:hypothetical protein
MVRKTPEESHSCSACPVGLQRRAPVSQPVTQPPFSQSGVGGAQAATSAQPPELLQRCGWFSSQRRLSGAHSTQKPSRQWTSQVPTSTKAPPVQVWCLSPSQRRAFSLQARLASGCGGAGTSVER